MMMKLTPLANPLKLFSSLTKNFSEFSVKQAHFIIISFFYLYLTCKLNRKIGKRTKKFPTGSAAKVICDYNFQEIVVFQNFPKTSSVQLESSYHR
jgi:hypothetical protein